jgi:hypothetical protein
MPLPITSQTAPEAPIPPVYNASAFDGNIQSDFLKLATIPADDRAELISYSENDFDDFKVAFLNYIKTVYGEKYNNFIQSDLGMMFVELFAYFAAILSFKGDFLANERFLKTAQNIESVRLILSNLGISLKGPIASKATAEVYFDNTTFTLGDTATIPETSRTITVNSPKDGKPLSFTLYKVNLTNGKIDLASPGSVASLELIDSYLSTEEDRFQNLVLLEGVHKTLEGSFSPDEIIQTIKIATPSIIEGSIFVSASDGNVYSQIPNIALASGAEYVFQSTYDSDYSVTLTFGNGVKGALPPATGSFKVFYRTGGGERGNIIKNAISVSVPGYKNGTTPVTFRVTNLTVATGGANAETIDHAKRYAPYVFASQYRAVTGKDYVALVENFVSQAGKSGKCVPAVRRSGAGGNMIDIYVLGKATENHLERASLGYKGELLTYLNQYKMETVDLTIVDGLIRTLDLVLTIHVDKSKKSYIEDIKRKAGTRIEQFFSSDRRDFGQAFGIQDLVRYILKVPEIRFTTIDNLKNDVIVNFNEIIQINNYEINVEYI